MSTPQTTTETLVAMAAKAAPVPPVSVSIAKLFGVPVSDLLVWATLIYTVLLIVHKVYLIYKDMRPKS